MNAAPALRLARDAQDRRIALTVQRERGRLLRYIRRRIADAAEAEDILQDAFFELVAASRLTQPIEQAGAWLTRVVRNRLIDRFRRQSSQAAALGRRAVAAPEEAALEDLLPAADGDPHTAALRAHLLQQLDAALAELPPAQREVFIAHELDGASFRELAARTGTSINTLLSRKHYATRALRRRLEAAWRDWIES
jgi:RNA polymerase sigma factor (sigma-70 family)